MSGRAAEVRFKRYEFDQLIARWSLSWTDAEMLRRLVMRCEWRPTNRGLLTTTYRELAEPGSGSDTVGRAMRRLSDGGLVAVIKPFRAGVRGQAQVSVPVYEFLIQVSEPMGDALDLDGLEIAVNAANIDPSDFAANPAMSDPGTSRQVPRSDPASSRHVLGITPVNAASAPRHNRDLGEPVGNREQRASEAEPVTLGSGAKSGEGTEVEVSRARGVSQPERVLCGSLCAEPVDGNPLVRCGGCGMKTFDLDASRCFNPGCNSTEPLRRPSPAART